MKRFFLSLIVVSALAGSLALPHRGSAHVLQTDGSIGAVLHIDPDDDPIASQPATLFFEFKDRQNKFAPGRCDCSVSIIRGGTIIFSTALFGSGNTSPTVSYAFPAKAVYTVRVTGTPTAGGSFQAFTLNYDIRVDREPTGGAANAAPAQPNHTSHYIIFGGGFIIFFLLIFRDSLKNRKKASAPKKPANSVRMEVVALIMVSGLFLHHTHIVQAMCSSHGTIATQEHQCCFAPAATLAEAATVPIPTIKFSTITVAKSRTAAIPRLAANNKSPPTATRSV